MNPKIVTKTRLKNILRILRKNHKKIVFTNGCFDLLHVGHVKYLQKAKKYGDILIVAVNSDSSVRRIKERGRPIMPQNDRQEILAALECVDYVVLFNELVPAKIINFIKPDLLIKGADYTLNNIVGRDTVQGYNGMVRTIPLVKGKSTSKIIKKIKNG